jgi:hypothetical protein
VVCFSLNVHVKCYPEHVVSTQGKIIKKVANMFCPCFGQNRKRQNKGKWKEDVLFRDAASTVWNVLPSVVVFLKCNRSKLHGRLLLLCCRSLGFWRRVDFSGSCRRFGEKCCLHLQGLKIPEYLYRWSDGNHRLKHLDSRFLATHSMRTHAVVLFLLLLCL